MTISLMAGCGSSTPTAAPAGSTQPAASQDASAAAPSSGATSDAKLPAGKNGQFKVGIASREIVNDVDRDLIAGVQTMIEAAGGTVVVTDAGGDPQKHNDNIESLINSGIDALAISLGDATQLAPEVAKAKAKGIIVVTMLLLQHVEGSLTDVSPDSAMMSAMVSRTFLEGINYKGDVYLFWVPGAPLLEGYKAVFEAIAKSYPAVTIHEVPTEHGAAKSLTQMQDILTANPNKGSIAGVWGAYDLLVSGADQAIKRAGRDEIKVIGLDGDKIGFQMLYEDGSPFIATAVWEPKIAGQMAADAIIKGANGQGDTVSTQLSLPSWIATRHNGVESAEKRWGASVWTDIKLDKAAILAKYPQTETVQVVQPPAP
jgi:ABC-type sugar transport system substrate-binding protein